MPSLLRLRDGQPPAEFAIREAAVHKLFSSQHMPMYQAALIDEYASLHQNVLADAKEFAETLLKATGVHVEPSDLANYFLDNT